MIDLTPATDRMRQLVSSIADDQLDAPTPCPKSTVGDLVDHVGSLTVAFTGAARKDETARSGPPPAASAANLGPDWRERIERDLAALADAWSDPAAWEGMSKAGGIEMPAQVCGLVALDELVLHGWDLAVASGQPYDPALPDVEAATSFVASFEAPRDGNLFGPIVPVADTAPAFDRLLGLAGRDPNWQPPA
jgi:uncharacterized protein (TIGR03086 family)